MAEFDWRVYGQETVAYMLSSAEVQKCASGLFKKSVTVGPGEAAVVVREGAIQDVVTQEKVQAAGVLDSMKRWFGGKVPLEIMYADLTPFDLTFDVSGVTQDKETLSGEAQIRVQTDLTQASGLIGLLKGKKGLARQDVFMAIQGELNARVLQPAIAQNPAEAFRGNKALLDQIAGDGRVELANTLATWGLSLDSLVINWGLTEQEALQLEQRRLQREEEAREFDHEREKREMARDQEIRRIEIENLQEIKIAQEQGDQEHLDVILKGELNRRLLEEGQRVDVAQIDARITLLNQQVEEKQAELDFRVRKMNEEWEDQRAGRAQELDLQRQRIEAEIQRAVERGRTEDKMSKFETVQAAKLRREQAEQAAKQSRIDTMSRERQQLMGLAGQGVQLDSDVAKEMLRQQSVQQLGDDQAAVSMDGARAQAEGAQHNLETYKEAEDRERQHQDAMAQQAANLMEASKQQPGATVVTGSGGASQASPTNINVVGGAAAAQPPQEPPQQASEETTPAESSQQDSPEATPAAGGSGLTCPKCNGAVQEGWKICPFCEAELSAAPKCPSCGADVQEGWKACPACGNKLGTPACPHCGGEIQAGWKACPSCGNAL